MLKRFIGSLHLLRRFRRDTKGTAAVEFALIAPMLALLSLGVIDVTHRVRMTDGFERSLFQIGDLLSRETNVPETYFATAFENAPKFMAGRYFQSTKLSYRFSSIGTKLDGDPLLLWSRTVGTPLPSPDINRYQEMASAGEAVIVLQAEISFTPIASFGRSPQPIKLRRDMVFKPRSTRAIAVAGQVKDTGIYWDAYEETSEGQVDTDPD